MNIEWAIISEGDYLRKRDPTEMRSESASDSSSDSESEGNDSGLESDVEDLTGEWDDADEATCAEMP